MSTLNNVLVKPEVEGRKLSIVEALREALQEEMRRDERVILIGEDIGIKGGFGGAFTVTLGLSDEFGSDDSLDARLNDLTDALTTLRSQSSAFGSNLSIVQNRQDFTKNMINTLETGAANLTLADTNEEAANLLALQTRQQLSTTALSLSAHADQAVLRLF